MPSSMQNIWLIARREYMERIRTKGFILATVLNLIGLAVNGLVIVTASRIGTAFSGRTRFRRAPQILLGTVFAGLAVRLAFDSRR